MPDEALALPDRPERLVGAGVAAWAEPIAIPSYLPEPPSRYPAYLDRRVYQGSSGRVYPLPFHDRIGEHRELHVWQGLHLENEYLRVLVLPELGGRIHCAIDKRTGYSMFYANPVIKPALVGLAGPWLAGGVEFNWPQHHRPATFLPMAWTIESGRTDRAASDGSAASSTDGATIWCSDHDPFARMKGMHGVRLSAGSTLLELQVRLFNRSDLPETFLWWANVAAEVHADYQSFFPADVRVVGDHAKRAVSTFPAASGTYYGVDYPHRRGLDTRPDSERRVPGDRLDWYRNIPVPTSYMCLDSAGDFFGGYDHRARAGFVHWAEHEIAVGKKQWSWGDAPFGHAWNRNLADDDSRYIELMAGVYTDNQPDFSYLAPGETKAFSQFWYPVAETGPVSAATLDAAVGVSVEAGETVLSWDVTRPIPGAVISVRTADGRLLRELETDLDPDRRLELRLPAHGPVDVELRAAGRVLLSWTEPASRSAVDNALDNAVDNAVDDSVELADVAAVEPPLPTEVASVEQLYLVGRHLEQYRHATRSPVPYWDEALRRDPGHAATHTALAARAYRQGRFGAAEAQLRAAIGRLTALNPNPADGEAHQLLGLTLARLGREDEAYAAFAKASWVRAWAGPAQHQLAILDARAGRNDRALLRAEAALRVEPEQLQVRSLRVVLLRRLGCDAEADAAGRATLDLDPLDAWALQLADPTSGGPIEAQTLIDLGCEYGRIGEDAAAAEVFERARLADADRPLGQTGCAVLADYHAARMHDRLGDRAAAAAARHRARYGDRTQNFPSRLDDVSALEWSLTAEPDDPTAAALLGHWLYAHGRADEAIERWQQSVRIEPRDPVVWRNLGVARYNHRHDARAAAEAYEQALRWAAEDPRLWFESDQLYRRAGLTPDARLDRLERASAPVTERDDLSVEYAHLLLSAGRSQEALALLEARRFQPWEGGEGLVLRAWERTQLLLADRQLRSGDPSTALGHARAALVTPEQLGEARHPLANPAQLLFAVGRAEHATGASERARESWRQAADSVGDFADMAPHRFSENTYYSVLAARAVGDGDLARTLTDGLADHLKRLVETPASVDFFATSLPNLLLFDEDPQRRQDLTVDLIRAQLSLLSDDLEAARGHLHRLLSSDPSHEPALDLLRELQRESPPEPAAEAPGGRLRSPEKEGIR